MTREPLRSGWQRLLHALGVAGGWVLFAYWWYLVAIADWDETDVALIIFVTLVVSPTLTLAWVLHNLGIFRRKGPRMAQPTVAIDYAQDWNGRTIEADWARLRAEPVVTVTVTGSRKLYRGATRVMPPARVAATETTPA